MNASELKFIADKVNKDALEPQMEEGVRRILVDLKKVAQQGKYSHSFFLSSMNLNRLVFEAIATHLRNTGYDVTFATETTAWYSNTDYDQEEVMKVSWL